MAHQDKSESMSTMEEGFKVEEEEEADKRVIPSEGVMRIGCLQKKSINLKGVSWDKRLVCLTENELLFARVDDPERLLVDWIALEDIVEVRERVDGICRIARNWCLFISNLYGEAADARRHLV